MAYKVSISHSARSDINEAVAFIAEDSPTRAKKWLDALVDQVAGLAEMPKRYSRLEEWPMDDVRWFLHHSHRVIYFVDDVLQEVVVIRVYHVARQIGS